MLTAIWLVPAAGALAVALLPRRLARPLGLLTAVATLAVALAVALRFSPGHHGYQFEEYVPWVRDLSIAYHLGVDGISLWLILLNALLTVIAINVLMFLGIFSRIIPSQALLSAIPDVTKRGAFNAISASLQQFAGGVSAAIAGAVIVAAPDGTLQHFNWLGFIVMAVAALSVVLMYFVHKQAPE